MEKYPVTSTNGNKYLVEVSYTDLMIGEVLYVKVYKEVSYKLFWSTKTKFIQVYSNYFEEEESYYRDIVGAVKSAVDGYEKSVVKKEEEKRTKEELFERSTKEFEEWDGDCK